MKEFEEHQFHLESTASYLREASRRAAGLSGRLRQMGTTPLQKSFFQAMALNLEFLAKMP